MIELDEPEMPLALAMEPKKRKKSQDPLQLSRPDTLLFVGVSGRVRVWGLHPWRPGVLKFSFFHLCFCIFFFFLCLWRIDAFFHFSFCFMFLFRSAFSLSVCGARTQGKTKCESSQKRCKTAPSPEMESWDF